MVERRESRWRQTVLGVAVLGALSLVQGTGLLRLGDVRVGPDLVLCAVLAWAFLNGSTAGAIWGFAGGLALDGLSAGPFGAACLTLTFLGIVAGIGRLGLYADDTAWVTAVGLIGSSIFYAAMLLAGEVGGVSLPLLPTLYRVVLPAVLLDTVCVVVLVSLLRKKSRRLAGRYQV
ncbi:MAG: rod shape-determining protein MreD [Anaerolineae bacterium]